MKNSTKTLDELSDSRLLYDKNPPTFGYLFILIVGAFLIGLLIWSLNVNKVQIVKVQGSITSKESNYVTSLYTGEIYDCNVVEGQLVNEGDILFNIQSIDYDLQKSQLEQSKKQYEDQIDKYELLVQSIKDDKNYFDSSKLEDTLYYSAYELYKSQVDQNVLDVSTYKNYGYTDAQIQSEIEKNQGKLTEIYYSAINEAENSIKDLQIQIDSIDSQLLSINDGKSNYAIKATESGTIHFFDDIKDGAIVQATQKIAVITQEMSDYVIEGYVSTSDVVRIKEGDNVKTTIDGLSQNVFGTIGGKVIKIYSNATNLTTESGKTEEYFKVLLDLDNAYLISRFGDKVDINVGMTTESRVQYEKLPYFYYFLEKIGIRVMK